MTNTNRSFNMLRLKIYVCPICGNVIIGSGESVISCCGITLPPLEAEEADEKHRLRTSRMDGELYVSMKHDMLKTHYISFMAGVSDSGIELVKLYPEGPCDARLKIGRTRLIYYYCNKHGLYVVRVDGRDRII